MTVIIADGNRFYADTSMVKDGEWFHSLSKIRAFDEPVALKSDVYHYDDVVYGWMYSGSFVAAEAFIKAFLTKPEALDELLLMYMGAMKLRLDAHELGFHVVLMGEKDNYQMEHIDHRSKKTGFEVIEKKSIIFFGAGHAEAKNEYVRSSDPIRAMYESFYMNEQCGGSIDVWELYGKPGKKQFARVELYDPLYRETIRALLSSDDPIRPSMVSYPYRLELTARYLGAHGNPVETIDISRIHKSQLENKFLSAILDIALAMQQSKEEPPVVKLKKPRKLKRFIRLRSPRHKSKETRHAQEKEQPSE